MVSLVIALVVLNSVSYSQALNLAEASFTWIW